MNNTFFVLYCRKETIRGYVKQKTVRKRCTRPLQQLRHDRRVHRPARRRGPIQRLCLRDIRKQTVRRECHQSPAPIPDHGGLLGPSRRQIRGHPERKGTETATANASQRLERSYRRPHVAADASGPVRARRAVVQRRRLPAAAAGHGRQHAAAATVAREHGELLGADRSTEFSDFGGDVAAHCDHVADVHGRTAGEGGGDGGGQDAVG